MNKTDSNNKVKLLREKLLEYEGKLEKEMLGYKGVIHESAASEIKHTKVMVLKAMIASIKEEIATLE